jgi:hypothetical protein
MNTYKSLPSAGPCLITSQTINDWFSSEYELEFRFESIINLFSLFPPLIAIPKPCKGD